MVYTLKTFLWVGYLLEIVQPHDWRLYIKTIVNYTSKVGFDILFQTML